LSGLIQQVVGEPCSGSHQRCYRRVKHLSDRLLSRPKSPTRLAIHAREQVYIERGRTSKPDSSSDILLPRAPKQRHSGAQSAEEPRLRQGIALQCQDSSHSSDNQNDMSSGEVWTVETRQQATEREHEGTCLRPSPVKRGRAGTRLAGLRCGGRIERHAPASAS